MLAALVMAQPHCAIVLPQPTSCPLAWSYSSLPHRAHRWLKAGPMQPSPVVPPTLVSVTELSPPALTGFGVGGIGVAVGTGVGVGVKLSCEPLTPKGSLVSQG